MKKVILQINNPDVHREDIARRVLNIISSVPEKGRFQVVIQNTPANTRLLNQIREERGICSIVAKHANNKTGNNKTGNDIHYFHKKRFLVPILCEEDRMFNLMTEHIRQLGEDKPEQAHANMSAYLHTFVRVNMLTEDGFDLFIKTIRDYWEGRGVDLKK